MRSMVVKKALALSLGVLFSSSVSVQASERQEHGNLVTLNVPATTADVTQRLRQYQNSRAAYFADWLADGKGVLMSTRFGDVQQVHRILTPMGAREQIGFYDEPVTSALVAPGKKYNGFVFQKDKGGDENHQIYFHDFQTGTDILLTDGISRNQSAVWTNSGEKLAYMSNRRTGDHWDVYLTPPDKPEDTVMIVQGDDFYWIPVAFSPDDSKLLMVNYISITESVLAVVDISTGVTTFVRDGEALAYYGQGAFSKDGKGLYFTSDAGSAFRTLRYFDFETGAVTHLSDDIAWDVTEIALSPDGNYLAFVVNRGGFHGVVLHDVKTGQRVNGPSLPSAVISDIKFSPDSSRLAMTVNSASAPADIYSYELKADTLTRWSKSEVGGLDLSTFAQTRAFDYPTFDRVNGQRRRIPAFLTIPQGQKGPLPVIIRIHGGPEGQALPSFSPLYHYWANELGFAVIQPNVRGSSGYGKSYLLLDNGLKREDSVKDIGALLDWIKKNPALDEKRVVLYGGSYGGYMVLASMTHYADRVAGAIDVVGISNFVTFLENTKGYRRDLRRVEYGDERNPAMRAHLESISPLNHIDKMTKPLFIVQGLNDPRVPATESEQLVKSMSDSGRKVWYMLAKDEGHGFKKKSNRDAMSAAMAMFLKDILAQKD